MAFVAVLSVLAGGDPDALPIIGGLMGSIVGGVLVGGVFWGGLRGALALALALALPQELPHHDAMGACQLDGRTVGVLR